MRKSRVPSLAATLLALAGAASCVVDDSFNDALFRCDPKGGADECPDDMTCFADGLCRHRSQSSDSGVGGKDGGPDGSCFPTTCSSLSPKCGVLDDGCGSKVSCDCQKPFTCGGGGKLGECGCTQQQSVTRTAGVVFEQKVTGAASWTNLDAARVSDDQWATTTAAVAAGKATSQLKASVFDFSLPAAAVVKGVEVKIERSAASSSSALKDQEVKLLIKGSAQSANLAKATAWSTGDQLTQYGSATELWGATSISAAYAMDSQFGVLLTVSASAADTPRVDAISMTLHFEDPACPN